MKAIIKKVNKKINLKAVKNMTVLGPSNWRALPVNLPIVSNTLKHLIINTGNHDPLPDMKSKVV